MNPELKRNRACESCRQLKVQCERDDSDPGGQCRRCVKSKRQCITTEPVRKRQRKSENRIEELEKKIEALTASLDVPGGSTTSNAHVLAELSQQPRRIDENWQKDGDDRASISFSDPPSVVSPGSAGRKRKVDGLDDSTPFSDDPNPLHSGNIRQMTQPSFISTVRDPMSTTPPDVIDRNIIDVVTATQIFNRYKFEMSEMLPFVRFPNATVAEDIRRTKPVLFLAILSVASGTIRADLQSFFIEEVHETLANRIICRGQKSLELLQALQVITVWYQPTETYEELNFNQLLHMAAVMGIDIGLGRRTKHPRRARWMNSKSTKYINPDPNDPETRRAWMGCYYACTSATMSLRTPLLVRWSPYLDDCLDVMANSPNALPSDKILSHLVQAQRIAENVAFQFSMDDSTARISITDPKTQYHMKAFERQLEDWRQVVRNESDNVIIKHTDGIISLYIHEIAMHHNHNIDEFQPAYGLDLDQPQDPDFITPAHIDSLSISIDSIHRALDAFLSQGVQNGQNFPTPLFARTSYAIVALLKIHSILLSSSSTFGACFKSEDLKVKYYLDSMAEFLDRIGKDNKCRVAQKFTVIMGMLSKWHAMRSGGIERPASTQPPEDLSTSGARALTSESRPGKKFALGSENSAIDSYDVGLENAGMTGFDGGPNIDSFKFTDEELNALGDLIETDPSWMNFDFDQTAWAF